MTGAGRPGRGAAWRARIVLALLLLAPAAAGEAAPVRHRPGAVSAAVFEARFGLRVSRVTLAGGGGMVDLRLTVADVAKARAALHGHGALRLVVGRAVLRSADHARRSVPLRAGATGYVLFPNAGNVVRPGQPASLELDGVRVEPVRVQ